MSETATMVTPEHFEYIAARTIQEDDFLRELKTAAAAESIPRIWISSEQAAFLRILLRGCGAREIVEVGTLAGYSSIQMARALGDGGRVRTIELSPKHAEFARRWIARSDVADRVEVIEGRALDVMRGFADASADAAFIDADKEHYKDYLHEALRIVRLGGLVLVDNAFAFGQLLGSSDDESVLAIRDFNERMARTRELESIITPFGDGCWVGVKIAEPTA